jgi:hypothetical protein
MRAGLLLGAKRETFQVVVDGQNNDLVICLIECVRVTAQANLLKKWAR